MQSKKFFAIATRLLLIMVAIVLALNFACAQGAGVYILGFFNVVPEHALNIRENVIQGVFLMQFVIKIIIVLGLFGCCYYVLKGVKTS